MNLIFVLWMTTNQRPSFGGQSLQKSDICHRYSLPQSRAFIWEDRSTKNLILFLDTDYKKYSMNLIFVLKITTNQTPLCLYLEIQRSTKSNICFRYSLIQSNTFIWKDMSTQDLIFVLVTDCKKYSTNLIFLFFAKFWTEFHLMEGVVTGGYQRSQVWK